MDFGSKKKQWYGKPEIVLALTAPGTDELEMEIYRPNMGQVNNVSRLNLYTKTLESTIKIPDGGLARKRKKRGIYIRLQLNSAADTTGDAKPSDLVENALGQSSREMLHQRLRRGLQELQSVLTRNQSTVIRLNEPCALYAWKPTLRNDKKRCNRRVLRYSRSKRKRTSKRR